MRIGDLSEKQRISIRDSHKRLNFWIGSVRSGKSFSALIRFMQHCISDVEGDFVIIGKTEGAIKRNIISELYNLAGDSCRYSPGNREIILYNRKIHVIGANDNRAEGKIRGASFGGALVDEASLIPENFFSMLLSRLSKKGAKLFSTTNPGSPFLWLKTDYLDRAKEIDASVFNFYLDDNPSLEESYKESLKKEYQGLWYSRFIEGKWVIAEGAVFQDFDTSVHCIKDPPAAGTFYVVGIDYGTRNACAFVLMGYNRGAYPNMWVEKEYYFDSRVAQKQKTDSEYARDLAEFVNGYNVKAIAIDPSASSFKLECYRSGISNIIDANNDVLPGIRTVATMLNEGTVKICENCVNLIKEMQVYAWDEKAALNGVEKPKKISDHAVDGFRYSCMAINGFVAGEKINQDTSSFSSMNTYLRPRL